MLVWGIPAPWWFASMLQEREEVGDYKVLGNYHDFRCSFVMFVLEELGASKKQHMMVIQGLLCIGRGGVAVLVSNCICSSPGPPPSSYLWQGTISTNCHLSLPALSLSTSLSEEKCPALPFLVITGGTERGSTSGTYSLATLQQVQWDFSCRSSPV